MEPDTTWQASYATKPDWWDIPEEPRCDTCGTHMEEAAEWCGDCGSCIEHCTTPDRR